MEENLIWGRRTVMEFLRAESPVNRLYILSSGEGLPREFFEMTKERGIPVVRCQRTRLDGMTGRANHQGVVGQVGARDFTPWQEVLERAAATGRPLFLLALDQVQDPGNFGALLRTAEAAGVQGVVVAGPRSCGLTAAVSKASTGADAYLPVARAEKLERVLRELAEAGVQVVATVPDGGGVKSCSYDELDYRKPTVFVLGAEGHGMEARVAQACNHRVTLPMLGKVESLNVAACGAILLYEAVRQRQSRL